MSRIFYFVYLAVFLFGLAVVLKTCVNNYQREKTDAEKCDESGGIYFKTAVGYRCVKVEVLK